MKIKRLDDEAHGCVPIWHLLYRTRFAVLRLRRLELANFGLTVEQSIILYGIRYSGGVSTPKRLEEITLRRQNSISTLTNRMIRSKLLSREKVPGKRRQRLMITSEGCDRVKKATTDSLSDVFSVLSPIEKQSLAKYLYVLREKVTDRSCYRG